MKTSTVVISVLLTLAMSSSAFAWWGGWGPPWADSSATTPAVQAPQAGQGAQAVTNTSGLGQATCATCTGLGLGLGFGDTTAPMPQDGTGFGSPWVAK